MKPKLPLALYAMLMAGMAGGVSYATSAIPEGHDAPEPMAPGHATVVWKPAPATAQTAGADTGGQEGKNTQPLGGIGQEGFIPPQPPDFAQQAENLRRTVDEEDGLTWERALSRAVRRSTNRNTNITGSVRSARDAKGKRRLIFSVGKGEEFAVDLDDFDTRAYWDVPEGYLPTTISEHWIPNGYNAVFVSAPQIIRIPMAVENTKGDTNTTTPTTTGTTSGTDTLTYTATAKTSTAHVAAPYIPALRNYWGYSAPSHVSRPAAKPAKPAVTEPGTGDEEEEDDDNPGTLPGDTEPATADSTVTPDTTEAQVGDTGSSALLTGTTPAVSTTKPTQAAPTTAGLTISTESTDSTAPADLTLTTTGGATPQESAAAGSSLTSGATGTLSPTTDPSLPILGAAGPVYLGPGETASKKSSEITKQTVTIEEGGVLDIDVVNYNASRKRGSAVTLDATKWTMHDGTLNFVAEAGPTYATQMNPSNPGSTIITLQLAGTPDMYGTIILDSQQDMPLFTFKDGSNFVAVKDAAGNDRYVDFHLRGRADTGAGLGIGSYTTEEGALRIGNLSGEVGSRITANTGNSTGDHYLSVNQTATTLFAGVVDNDWNSKNVSILKNGNGDLFMTGYNMSSGKLKVNEGTITFGGELGSWAGEITVADGATLAYAGVRKVVIDPADEEEEGWEDEDWEQEEPGIFIREITNGNTDVTFNAGATLLIRGACAVDDFGGKTQTEFEAAKVRLNRDLTVTNVVVEEGAELYLGQEGDTQPWTLTIGATMHIDGTLTVNGRVEVSSLAHLNTEGNGEPLYTDRLAPGSGNGFENAVYELFEGEGTVTGLDRVYVSGSDSSYEVGEAGKIWVSDANGRYFVNTGTVVYGADDNVSYLDDTQVLVLNGGTLEMAKDLRSRHSFILAKSSTLQIDAGVVLKNEAIPTTAGSATLTITGTGTYDLGSGNNRTVKAVVGSMNPSAAFGEDWKGAIRLSDLAFGNGDNSICHLNSLAVYGSWVELMNSKGSVSTPGMVITPDIRLTGANALVINKGSANTAYETTFSGKMGGSGDFVITSLDTYSAKEDSFIFTGDVSAWNGKVILQHNVDGVNGTNDIGWNASKAVKLVKFSGEGDVNVDFAVTHTGSNTNTMNVEIAGDTGSRTIGSDFSHGTGDTLNLTVSGASTKTFTGDVDVATLTATGAQAAFTSTLKADTLVVGTAGAAGDVVLGGTATLGDVQVNTGSLTFAAGSTIDVSGDFHVAEGLTAGGTNAITFKSGSGFTKTGAGTLELAGTADFTAAAVREGVLKLDAAGGFSFGHITLGHSEEDADTHGTLVINNTAVHNRFDTLLGLTLDNDADMRITGQAARMNIGGLALKGNTLTLKDNHTAESTVSAYYIAGDYAGEGTLAIRQESASAHSAVAVALAGEDTLKDVVIDYQYMEADGYNTIAIAAANVKVAGLKSEAGRDKFALISKEIVTTYGAGLNESDSVTRTLTITGNGKTNTFNGDIGANLNIVMDGTGTQKFTGDASAFNGSITVEAGTLGFTQTMGSAGRALTSIDVNAGTLNLVGGYTDTLNVAGTLNITGGTLTVNNLLGVKDGGAINISGISAGLDLGQYYVLDLIGLTPISGSLDGERAEFRIFSAETAAKVTGISNGAISMSHIRTDDIGWAATYQNGVLTLEKAAAIIRWNSPDTIATWATDSAGFVDDHTIGTTGKTGVKVETSLTATLGEAITIGSLGVDEDVSLTLEGGKQLILQDINIEQNATLDTTGVNLVFKEGEDCTVDVSRGGTFITNEVAGGVYTGKGTVQIGFGTGTGAVAMGMGSQFEGTVDVTSGTADLGGSYISTSGKWKLEAGVDATLSGTAANAIILVGADHTFTTEDAGTLSGNLSGTDATAGFTKAGAGNLTLSGTNTLGTLTVAKGTLTLGGETHTTLENLTMADGTALAFSDKSGLRINGTLDTAVDITMDTGVLRLGENFTKTGTGTFTIADTINFNGAAMDIREGAIQLNTGDSANQPFDIGKVTLAAGTKLIQKNDPVNGNYVHRQILLDSLTLTGDASIEGRRHNGHFDIGGMTLGGHTLTIDMAGESDTWAHIALTGAQNAADPDSAVTVSSQSKIQLSLTNGAALGKSMLTLNTPGNSQIGVLALAAADVDMLGLSGGNAWKLVSNANAAAGTDSNGVDGLAGDGTKRTLTITGDGGGFAGAVGANVNIAMRGTGAQKFSGDVSAMNGTITVASGELSFSNTLETGNTVTLTGGSLKLGADSSFASVSGSVGSTLYTATAGSHTLTLTGEGRTFAGTLGKMDITLAPTATGIHKFSGTTPGSFDNLTLYGGTFELTSGATVGNLTVRSGATLQDSGTLTVAGLDVTGGSIIRTNIVYNGTEGTAVLGASVRNGSLEVADNAGAITLTGATKNFTDLIIHQSSRTADTDDILLDADVTVSGTLTLEANAQIGFGDNRQLQYDGFTFTTDEDSATKGTINKRGKNGAVTASNMRITRKDAEAAELVFRLLDVQFVNGAGAGVTTLSAEGNRLSEIIIAGGEVHLSESTEVTDDVTLAVGSAKLYVAEGKTITNGVITMTGSNGQRLLIDNKTTAASVFHGGSSTSAAIIEDADITVDTSKGPDGTYTWDAKLVDSTLDLKGDLYLSNSNQHSLAAFTIAEASSLTLKNGATLSIPSDNSVFSANVGEANASITNNGTSTSEVSIGSAGLTFSNTAITITQNPGVSFLAGAKNVDLVVDYNGTPTAPVFIKQGAGREGERSFHDIVLTNGDVRLDDSVTLTGDLYIANANHLYINKGKQLVSDGGVICIEGVGKEGEEYATIDFDHGFVHGADYSRLNGTSASVKVTGAEVTITNSGTGTYEWRAALSESSLTTTGDVTLNYYNDPNKITQKLTDLNVQSGTTTLRDDVEISGLAMLGAGAVLVENQYNSITDGYVKIYTDSYGGSAITNVTGSAASVFGNNDVANQGVSMSLVDVTLHSGNTYTWGAAFEGGVKLSIGDKGQSAAHLTLTNTTTTHSFSDIQFAKSSTLTLKNGVSMYYKNLSSTGVMLTEANIEGKDATITNRRHFYGSSGNEGYIKGYTGLLLQDATLTLYSGGTLYMPVSNVDLVVTKDPSIDKLTTPVLKIDYTTAQNEHFGYDGRKLEFRNIKVMDGEVWIDTHSITVSQNVEIAAGSLMTINGDADKEDKLHKATIFKPDGLSTTIYINDGDRGHSLVVDDGILTITGNKDFAGKSGKDALTPESNDIATVITQDGEGTSSLLAGADASAKVLWADISLRNTKANTYVWGAYLEDSTLKVAGTADLTNTKGAKLSNLRVGFYDEEEPGENGYKGIYTVKNYVVTEKTADADLTVRGKLEVDTVTVREGSKLTAAGGATINNYVDAHGETTFGNATTRTTTEGGGDELRAVTVDEGVTLRAINSPLYNLDISRAEVEGATGSINLDLVGGAPLGADVTTAIAGKVEAPEAGPGNLKALMNACSLKNADVVVRASDAIDEAARVDGDFWYKEFTLNIFKQVQVGSDVTLELAGMENYYDIVLHIRPSESAIATEALDAGGSTSSVEHIVYTGKYNLSENYNGQVVDVWVTFGVPEPATGTLSVLALAALAARRRRKK